MCENERVLLEISASCARVGVCCKEKSAIGSNWERKLTRVATLDTYRRIAPCDDDDDEKMVMVVTHISTLDTWSRHIATLLKEFKPI